MTLLSLLPPQLSEVQPQWSGSHPRDSLAKYRNDSVSGRLPRALLRPGVGESKGRDQGLWPHTLAKAGKKGLKGSKKGLKDTGRSCPDHSAAGLPGEAPW